MPRHPPGGVSLATASGFTHSEQPITHRRDWWWAFPLFTLIVYVSFIVYATYRVLDPWIAGAAVADYASYYYSDNGNYHYLAPFGTPDLTFLVPGILHEIPWVGLILHSPAAVILIFPAGFRFTCYYYRKSYYRAFTARPYGCAIPAAKGVGYNGERGLLVVQNLHRYFLYAAIAIWVLLTYDAIRSIITPNGLYFGFGSAIMLINVTFLAFYTFGCHSFRHLIGGKLDMFSCDPLAKWRYGWWSKITMLNNRHALWAWLSLFSVAGVDAYIRFVVAPMQEQGITHLFGVIPL